MFDLRLSAFLDCRLKQAIRFGPAARTLLAQGRRARQSTAKQFAVPRRSFLGQAVDAIRHADGPYSQRMAKGR
ncbi:MAG: hypothetical protein CMH85_14435 [Novosphingobium sp.]|nr:hypothetical protein [Novosphingobium sp.]